MTLYELKEKLATLNAQINVDANWIAEKASSCRGSRGRSRREHQHLR